MPSNVYRRLSSLAPQVPLSVSSLDARSADVRCARCRNSSHKLFSRKLAASNVSASTERIFNSLRPSSDSFYRRKSCAGCANPPAATAAKTKNKSNFVLIIITVFFCCFPSQVGRLIINYLKLKSVGLNLLLASEVLGYLATNRVSPRR